MGAGMLVGMIWLDLCASFSSSCCNAISIILSSNKIQMDTFWYHVFKEEENVHIWTLFGSVWAYNCGKVVNYSCILRLENSWYIILKLSVVIQVSSSYKKNTQATFSEVGVKASSLNLLSSATAIMLLGITNFFGAQSQNRWKFSNLEEFRPKNALHWKFRE